MKVLITGSSGLLGRHIINNLKSKSIKCIGIDIVDAPTTDYVADITKKESLKPLFEGVDHVIHSAALHGKHYDLNYPRKDFIETNINGTLNLLELSVQSGVKKFVFTSTTSIYGEAMVNAEQAVWVDEALVPQPRDIYDITKQAAENLCLDFFDKEGLKSCVIRVSRFMDEPINNIANYRLYRGLDESDSAEGHYLALMNEMKKFEIYNVSNKSPFQKNDLEALKKDPRSVILKYHPEAEAFYKKRGWQFPHSIDRVYDISKAEKMLGFKPKENFIEFVGRF